MSRLDLLRDTRLFSGCREEELKRLEAIGQDRVFPAGEPLFSLDEEARELMVVASGKLQLELPVSILGEARSVAFETKGRGDVVGWSSLVPPHRFTLTARARTEVSVLAFGRRELTGLFEDDPGLGFRAMTNLASIVGRRFHHTQEMWAREVQRSLDERYR